MSSTRPNASSSSFGGALSKVIGLLLIPPTLLALLGVWYFGLDHHHDSAATILPGRAKELTPPEATDLVLDHQFFLDHTATYIVSEEDLVAFLEEYFGESDRRPQDPKELEHVAAARGWTWSSELVVFHCVAGYGGTSEYYHDPATGQTYQASVHW